MLDCFFNGENEYAGETGVLGAAFSILFRSSYKLCFKLLASSAASATSGGAVAASASGTSSIIAALAVISPALGACLVGYASYAAWSHGQGRAFTCLPGLPIHPPPTRMLPSLLLGEDVLGAVQAYFCDNLPDCPVCLDHLFWGNDLVFTPCHHCFHASCLQLWQTQGCPVCRASLPPEQVLNLTEWNVADVDELALYGIGHLSLDVIEAAFNVSAEVAGAVMN